LENELSQGAWFTAPARLDDVFCDEDELWRVVSRRIGHEMLAVMLKIKHVPDDPSLN
jgi:putative transcriptional regulator